MNRKQRLQSTQAELVDEREQLLELLDNEKRGPTTEEVKREGEITTELKSVDAQIDMVERDEARQRQSSISTAVLEPADIAAASIANIDDGSSGNVGAVTGAATTVTKQANAAGFASFGHQLQALAEAGMGNPRLLLAAAASGMSEAVPSDGGYLVLQQQAVNMREDMFTGGQVLKRTRRMPIGADFDGVKIWGVDETSRGDGSRHGGVQGYWLDEAGTFTASKPKYNMLELRLSKVGAIVYLTGELLKDTVALEAHVTRVVPDELMFKTENAIFRGTGAGQPDGILGADATVEVAKESGQAANTVEWDNIKKMWTRMIASSRANAVWFINQDIEPQLMSMVQVVGTGGVPVYLPASGASSSPFATLMGRPVIPVEYCSTLGTAGDIVFADMSQYIMIDKGGVEQASSMHVRFLNDEMTFRFLFRVDGQSLWNSAKTPFQGSDTLSPFITLATRS